MSDAEKTALGREVDEALRQGVLAAGKTGTGGERDFDELLNPQQNWREVLREFIQSTCRGRDYATWRRPNRRFIGAGIYMPSGISEKVGEILVAPDTSGSTFAPGVLPRMLSEIKGIADTVRPESLRLLYWDTSVCKDEHYEGHDLDAFVDSTEPEGGGGTMVECVPEYMAEHRITPQVAIVFTDGYLGGSWGQWNCPVLWVIVDNAGCRPPFGTVAHVTSRDV